MKITISAHFKINFPKFEKDYVFFYNRLKFE